MKVATIVILGLVLFAAVAYGAPEAEAEAEAEAEPFNPFKKIGEGAKKLYKKICKNKAGDNKCKAWAKKNITWSNAKKFVKEFKPLIQDFCENNEEAQTGTYKTVCTFAAPYLEE